MSYTISSATSFDIELYAKDKNNIIGKKLIFKNISFQMGNPPFDVNLNSINERLVESNYDLDFSVGQIEKDKSYDSRLGMSSRDKLSKSTLSSLTEIV